MFNGPNRRKGRPPTVKPKYRVNLTYFTQVGKYYSQGTYVSEKEDLFEIFNEVAEMKEKQQLPGLFGVNHLPILIDVPTHPDRRPHFVL